MEVNSFYVKLEPDIFLTADSQSHSRSKDSPASPLSPSGLATKSDSSKTYNPFNRTATWNELFVKFSTEMANDSEVDLEVLSLKEEEIEFSSTISESEAEEVSEDEIVTETRMPMRKTSAWIRHWIETGKSPYLDTPEEELVKDVLPSEGGISKCRTLIIGGNAPPGESLSLCSSVDTAVYILSNTNITKKSEAMAIVEGSRESPDEFPIFSHSSRGYSSRPAEALQNNASTNPLNDVDTEGPVASTSKTSTIIISTPAEKEANLSQANEEQPEEAPVPTLKPMKITDALLTLEHIANITQPTSTNDNFSAIFSMSPKSASKTTVRKKLYTGRDSPMDLILPTEMNKSSINGNSERHPALMTTPRMQLSKRRVGRPIKRRVSRPLKDAKEKTAEKSSENADTFFTSLGLTPSDKDSSSRQRKSPSVSPSRDEENTTELKTKLSALEELCAAKRPVISLERVTTHLSVNGDATSENNNSGADVEQSNVTTMTITSSSSTLDSLQNNSCPKEVQNVDLDSLKSDQSTILIYKCARETGNTKNKGSKVKKVKPSSQAAALNNSPVKQSSEVQEKRKINLSPIRKKKRKSMSLLSASSGSEDDSPRKIESSRLNAKQKQTSSIEISTCLDKTLQKKLTTTQDSIKSLEKSVNFLDRDQSNLAETTIPAVSRSTLEIVSSEDETWIDIKQVQKRRKTMAKKKPASSSDHDQSRVTEKINPVESQNTLETVTSENEAWLEAKRDKKRRMTVAKNKSASSLDRDQSCVTEEVSPAELQSTSEIVTTKKEAWINVKNDKNRRKTVATRQNQAQPSKGVEKLKEKSSNFLNRDKNRLTEKINPLELQTTLEVVPSEKEASTAVKNDKNRQKTVAKQRNQTQPSKEAEKPQEKSTNSLDHNQSHRTEEISPVESQSTLEIVTSETEDWINVKNDKNKRKTVATRRNQAQPSEEVEKPIEKSSNSLDRDENRSTEKINPLELQTTLEIVAAEKEASTDVKNDKNRGKTVAKRRNQTQPSKEAEKPQEKSTNSLDHDQSHRTEERSPVESQSTLEIVTSETEDWINVKNDKNRRKTVATRRNRAQPSKEAEKLKEKSSNSLDSDQSRITEEISPVESQIDVKNDKKGWKTVANQQKQVQPSKEVENPVESTRNLRKRKLPEGSSPESWEKSRKSAVKRLKFTSDSEASSTELYSSKKKLKASVSSPSLPSIVEDGGKKDLPNSVDKNDSIAMLNGHAKPQKEEKNKIGTKLHRKQSPVKKVTPEADENCRITRSGKKSARVKESDTEITFETPAVKSTTKNRKINERRQNNLNNSNLNDSNLNNSNIELKNLSVSLSRIQSPVINELLKKTRSKSFPMEKKILPRVNTKQITSYVRITRSSGRLQEMNNKNMSSPLSRLRSNKNSVQKLNDKNSKVDYQMKKRDNISDINNVTSQVFPCRLDNSVKDATSFLKTLRTYNHIIDNKQNNKSIITRSSRTKVDRDSHK